MSRVVHFEIQADEPERAADFYSEVFDWTIQKKWTGDSDYWLIHTGRQDEKGINGGMRKRLRPNASIVNSVEVDSIDESSTRIVKAGGKLLTPKVTIPHSGTLLYCEDTEGNVFCIIEKSQAE